MLLLEIMEYIPFSTLIYKKTTMSNSLVNVWIHAVWNTKDKLPLLHKRWRYNLFKHIRYTAKSKGYQLDHINGIKDHVHLIIKIRSTQDISSIMKNLKGEASYWINENKLMNDQSIFRWQRGYYAVSVSPDRIDVVRNYIRKQEEHHQTKSLEYELATYFS